MGDFTPQTVNEAIKVLRKELLKHGDLYKGFYASILSVFKEMGPCVEEIELAENILKRIIGEEIKWEDS